MTHKRLYSEYRGLQVPMSLEHGPVTSSGKSAPGTDPRIRHRIQIGMFRPIRVDHTNCLQVAIKTHSVQVRWKTTIKTMFPWTTVGFFRGDRQRKCFSVDRQ
jgi:hypothetical protein